MTEFLRLSREVAGHVAVSVAAIALGIPAGIALAALSFAIVGDTDGAMWVLHGVGSL